jgi:hypothetical protein
MYFKSQDKNNSTTSQDYYTVKISFKISGKIKNFQDKYKLEQFMFTKLALQKILTGILHR